MRHSHMKFNLPLTTKANAPKAITAALSVAAGVPEYKWPMHIDYNVFNDAGALSAPERTRGCQNDATLCRSPQP